MLKIINNKEIKRLNLINQSSYIDGHSTVMIDGIQGKLAFQSAKKLCKGKYQTNLILGNQNWSGSDLKGTARNWSSKYAKSRRSLLSRLKNNNVPYCEMYNKHGKTIVILGVW